MVLPWVGTFVIVTQAESIDAPRLSLSRFKKRKRRKEIVDKFALSKQER